MTQTRKGIILAGGSGTRLYPVTRVVSKQLLPVYDKPMIYYPLSVLMLAGIREILIISTPHDLPLFERLLGDGSELGLSLSYQVQEKPNGLAEAYILGESFLNNQPSAMVLGDNLFFGNDLQNRLKLGMEKSEGATVYATSVQDPERYGVVELNADNKPVRIVEKPVEYISEWAVTGLYFYDAKAPEIAKSLKPSPRGELEITDITRFYMENDTLDVVKLGRGFAWLDTGTHASMQDAGNFVRIIEERQNTKIACIEEIALMQGWINTESVLKLAHSHGKSSYGEYLHRLVRSEGKT